MLKIQHWLLVRVLDLCLRLLREKESFHLLLLPLWKWEAGNPVAVLLRSSLQLLVEDLWGNLLLEYQVSLQVLQIHPGRWSIQVPGSR